MPRSAGRLFRRNLLIGLVVVALSAGWFAPEASAQPAVRTASVVLSKAAAPRLLSAGSSELAIDWSDFGQAPAYRVRYSKYSSLKKSVYKRATSSQIVLSGLKSSTKYYVRVRAIKADAKGTPLSAYSAKKSFKTAKKLSYAAPTSLGARGSARGADAIAVSWAFAKSGLRYQVQYARTADFADPGTTIARGPSVAVLGLAPSTGYHFRVRAIDAAGKPASSWSRVIEAMTKTPADPRAKPLQVASFNIRNGTKSSDTGSRAWSVRRGLVAAQFTRNDVDVAGLQEAEYTYLTGADGTWKHQYQDLLDVLSGDWKIT